METLKTESMVADFQMLEVCGIKKFFTNMAAIVLGHMGD